MRCLNCDTVSLSACCPKCGACEITNAQLAGFDPTDIFNPFGLGYDLAKSGINPMNPVGMGENLGQGLKDGSLTSGVKGATGAIASLASTMKWVMIGSAVVLGGIALYGGIKFIPVVLGFARSESEKNADFVRKFAKSV